MKFTKLPLPTLTLAAAGFAAVAAAPDAQACEDCVYDPRNDGYMCWSGFSSGFGACWGGGPGEYCQTEGSCSDPSLGEGCDPNFSYCESEAWDDYMCYFWCHC